jgi:hypothetical protein
MELKAISDDTREKKNGIIKKEDTEEKEQSKMHRYIETDDRRGLQVQ